MQTNLLWQKVVKSCGGMGPGREKQEGGVERGMRELWGGMGMFIIWSVSFSHGFTGIYIYQK